MNDEAKGAFATSPDSTMAYEDEDADCIILEPKPRLLKPSISIGSSSWEMLDVQLDDENFSGHEELLTGVSSSGHFGLPKGDRPILHMAMKAPKKKPAGNISHCLLDGPEFRKHDSKATAKAIKIPITDRQVVSYCALWWK